LENRENHPRRHGRRRLRVDASLRDGSGATLSGALTDLSQAGCRMEVDDAELDDDQMVIVRPGALGGVSGRVRWTRGNAAGVEFTDPLHPAMVDHVSGERELEGHAPPPRRHEKSGFTDNFGRPLPTLGNRRGR
jgi:hypothetical protein